MYHQKNETSQESNGEGPVYSDSDSSTSANTFYRIEENKMISGVCTGLAAYFDIDVTLIRLLWVFAALASAGLAIIAYIFAVIFFPTSQPLNGGK